LQPYTAQLLPGFINCSFVANISSLRLCNEEERWVTHNLCQHKLNNNIDYPQVAEGEHGEKVYNGTKSSIVRVKLIDIIDYFQAGQGGQGEAPCRCRCLTQYELQKFNDIIDYPQVTQGGQEWAMCRCKCLVTYKQTTKLIVDTIDSCLIHHWSISYVCPCSFNWHCTPISPIRLYARYHNHHLFWVPNVCHFAYYGGKWTSIGTYLY